MAPEFATDEREEVRVTESLAIEPLSQSLRIETGAAEHGACVFCRFLKIEWLKRAVVIKADGGFSETSDARKIIALCGETDAEVHAFDSEALKLISHYQCRVLHRRGGEVMQVIKKENCAGVGRMKWLQASKSA